VSTLLLHHWFGMTIDSKWRAMLSLHRHDKFRIQFFSNLISLAIHPTMREVCFNFRGVFPQVTSYKRGRKSVVGVERGV